jgi:hypothetical protein
MNIVPATHRTQSLLAGLLLSFAITLAAVSTGLGQELSEITMPPNGDNQKAEVSQWIGLVKITIAYHSPNVHRRRERPDGPYLGRVDTVRLL